MRALVIQRPLVGLGLAVILIGFLAVAWWLISPLFIRTSLVETPLAPGTSSDIQRLGIGSFSDRDLVHKGSGQAILQRLPGGQATLQLADFRVTNGPDLYVFLSTVPDPSSEDLHSTGLNLGRLKASEGAFGYELPAGTDISKYKAAVIYCLAFRTIFTVAPFSTV
jgi:hypothetical protein